MITTALTTLSEVMTGRVVSPGDPDYDEARHGFNLSIDHHPIAVAYPVDEHDVVAIVNYAREHGITLAPRATGHNSEPLGTMEDILLVSVAEMTDYSIDAEARRVRVGAGTKWGAISQDLSDLGLAGLHGSSPDVGIAGYSLGGGMGWLARKYGLQTSSVTAIELVTADGRLVRTDATHEPDLFWALRGGGGNFGIVTAIEFSVYPVQELYAGVMFFPFERLEEVLHTWNGILPSLPEEFMTWAGFIHFPDIPQVPEPVRGGSYALVWAAFLGEEDDGRFLTSPIRDLGPAMDTFAMVPPSALGPLAMDPEEPESYRTGHVILGEAPTAAIDRIVEQAGPGSDSSVAVLVMRHMGGALERAAENAGARATLPGEVVVFALGAVQDEESRTAARESIEALTGALQEYTVGPYPNFVEQPADASEFFDPETWDRLRQVKSLYDPADMFRGNHHIPPA